MTEVVDVFGSSADADTHREADKPAIALDPALFWCNPREGEFYAAVRAEVTVHEFVKATTREEARAKIEAAIEAGTLDVDGADIDDARIDYVRAEQPMYLVHRPGTTVNGTSRIQPGDEPREPKDDYERRIYTRPPTTAPEAVAVGTTEGREPKIDTTREGADR